MVRSKPALRNLRWLAVFPVAILVTHLSFVNADGYTVFPLAAYGMMAVFVLAALWLWGVFVLESMGGAWHFALDDSALVITHRRFGRKVGAVEVSRASIVAVLAASGPAQSAPVLAIQKSDGKQVATLMSAALPADQVIDVAARVSVALGIESTDQVRQLHNVEAPDLLTRNLTFAQAVPWVLGSVVLFTLAIGSQMYIEQRVAAVPPPPLRVPEQLAADVYAPANAATSVTLAGDDLMLDGVLVALTNDGERSLAWVSSDSFDTDAQSGLSYAVPLRTWGNTKLSLDGSADGSLEAYVRTLNEREGTGPVRIKATVEVGGGWLYAASLSADSGPDE